ncbi:hypothetical protein FB446DRAFT_726043 [Lentinula raphanica]|uniref:DUF6534 domain-containing protein n=1 Tax=Lentinula raphanica TaxID=153919 RepID=A0AA38UJP6_9AGAR|nr:hypothetical protein C8R42DRAFT_706265 [Lentinula raphanica]KAJ3775213.1 hypothetical protein FB446DRAFT_726043 [Lentinula raphanica]KAJ3843825.1 hypothetical protein F5878DRAFT_219283 [Lentinula raphanica]
MTQAATLDNTMGAMFIGVLCAAVLYGAACIQTWYYYVHQKDRWPLRALVAAVMITDTLHQALIAHTLYTYLITNFGNALELGNTVWSLLAEVLVNGFTAVLVQSFLAHRVWQLSNGNIWISVPAVLLVAAEFVCVFVFAVIGLTRVQTFAELAELLTGLSITVNVLAAVGDTYIAALLTLLLHTSRTGFRRSDSIINKLIIFSINTGALTSLCAIASMLSILLAPNTFIYISFFFCMGRLYANSLLATLNVRSLLRKDGGSNVQASNDTGSIPLGAYNTSVFNPPSAISVKIDTRREFVSDRSEEQKHADSHMDMS